MFFLGTVDEEGFWFGANQVLEIPLFLLHHHNYVKQVVWLKPKYGLWMV